jgi:hypothetical protein
MLGQGHSISLAAPVSVNGAAGLTMLGREGSHRGQGSRESIAVDRVGCDNPALLISLDKGGGV